MLEADMDIKRILAERGTKHAWIANEIGISVSMFSLIMQGRSRFPPDKIDALHKIINRPPRRVPRSELVAAVEALYRNGRAEDAA